jgi:hypothetical protein
VFNKNTKIVEKNEDDTKDLDAELDSIEKGNDSEPADGNAAPDADADGGDASDASGNAADGMDGDGEGDLDASGGTSGGGSSDSGSGISVGGGFDGSDSSSDSENTDDKEKDSEPEANADQPPVDQNAMSQTDEEKVNSMFTDTGNIDYDYSLSNENNVRLAKFKFKKANVDYSSMFTENEKETGVPADEIELRMSPEQKMVYRKSNNELRKKYPKIDAREKNIIIYNSNVPFVKRDVAGNEIALEDNEIQDAYKKINQYMIKKFGQYWQDKHSAIDFINSIKVNFSSKKSIRPNLSYAKDLFPESDDVIGLPFDTVTIKIPSDVDEFLRNNLDNEKFKKSSVFRTLASGYLDINTKSNGVYAIITPDEPVEPPADEPPTDSADSDSESDNPEDIDELEAEPDTTDETDSDIENAEVEI